MTSGVAARPLSITCVGGGPAGLFFAILARAGGHQITVVEHQDPDQSFGWGVVFWDNLLRQLDYADPSRPETCARTRTPGTTRSSSSTAGRRSPFPATVSRCGAGSCWSCSEPAPMRSACGSRTRRVAGTGGGVCRGRPGHRQRRGAQHPAQPAAGLRHPPVPAAEPLHLAGQRPGVRSVHLPVRAHVGRLALGARLRLRQEREHLHGRASPQTWAGLGFDRMGLDETVAALERHLPGVLDGAPATRRPAPGTGPRGTGSSGCGTAAGRSGTWC